MAIKLSEAKTSLERLKRDISDIDSTVSGTFIEWCNFANRQIYNYVRSVDNSPFVQEHAFSSAIGAQDLPSDLLTFSGQGLGFYTLSNGEPSSKMRRINYGDSLEGYYLKNDQVIFSNSQKQVKLRYIPVPVTFTSESEYFTLDGTENGQEIIPEFYLEALRDDLNRYYTQWDETDESLADFRFARTLSAMQGNINRSPRARRIPRFNSAY